MAEFEDAMREENVKELQALQHAMQTGVAYDLPEEVKDTEVGRELKHLRVGVNSAMIFHAALVKVLMDKGIVTLDEYMEAQLDLMKAEVKAYEKRLSKKLGADIHLA